MFGSSFWSSQSSAETTGVRGSLLSLDGGASGSMSASQDGSAFGATAQRRRRDWADGLLYDLESLDPRSDQAVKACRAGAALVAHPDADRPIAVYSDAGRFLLSLDRGARVLALAGPGSSAVAAAVLAQRTADALGEPVVGVAPPRGMSDLTLDLVAPVDPRGVSAAARTSLATLLRGGRRDFALIVAHRLGGLWLSETDCAAKTRIITVGGAAEPTGREDALHLIGGQDWYGWSISTSARLVSRVAPFAGGHINPKLPYAFPFDAFVCEAAADLGF